MLRQLSPHWLIPLAVVVLLLAACDDSTDEAADTTVPATTTTVASTTPTAATTTTGGPPALRPEAASARANGEPFDIAQFDLCEWFTDDEIRQITADAYAQVGVDWGIPAKLAHRRESTVMWLPMPDSDAGCEWFDAVDGHAFRVVAAPVTVEEYRTPPTHVGWCHTLSGPIPGCEHTLIVSRVGGVKFINDPGKDVPDLEFDTDAFWEASDQSDEAGRLMVAELVERLNWQRSDEATG